MLLLLFDFVIFPVRSTFRYFFLFKFLCFRFYFSPCIYIPCSIYHDRSFDLLKNLRPPIKREIKYYTCNKTYFGHLKYVYGKITLAKPVMLVKYEAGKWNIYYPFEMYKIITTYPESFVSFQIRERKKFVLFVAVILLDIYRAFLIIPRDKYKFEWKR